MRGGGWQAWRRIRRENKHMPSFTEGNVFWRIYWDAPWG